MSESQSTFRLLPVLLVLGGALLAQAAQGADPFYENLMRKGADEYNAGRARQASRTLERACFGMLDEPDTLAACLTRLALADVGAGENEDFHRTFLRIAEVEARFSGYTRAQLPPEIRRAFETEVARLVPEQTLLQTPGFARLVPTPQERIQGLSGRERRERLQALMRDEPDDDAWPLMLAEDDLGSGREKEAVDLTDAVLRRDPGNVEALRVKGLALAGLQRWEEAVEALRSAGTPGDHEAALALVHGLVEVGDPAAAIAAFDALPEPLRSSSDIGAFAASAWTQVAGAQATPAPTPAETPSSASEVATEQTASNGEAPAEEGTSPGAGTPAAGHSSAPRSGIDAGGTAGSADRPGTEDAPVPSAALAEAARIRGLLEGGRPRAAYEAAAVLADTYPAWSEAQFLAGELAYRSSAWVEAVRFFERGGDPGDDHPALLFYEAVALHETGQKGRAAEVLRRALPHLRRNAFVDRYVTAILGPGR